MKQRYIFRWLFIIFVIFGFFAWKAFHHTLPSNNPSKSITQPRALPKIVDITLNKNGFSPKVVTINAGSAIVWKNVSGTQQTVNSDNYPPNQLHKELNFGVFNSGSSVTHTFTAIGTYGYHNQFHHEQTGKIIVVR